MKYSYNYNTILNIIAGIISFTIQSIISFILTPYIVSTLGTDAYGFIGLSSNIISYISLASIALNSVGARYISIKYHQGDINSAQQYYSSIFLGNVVISMILIVPIYFIIKNIKYILNIPIEIASDVKALLSMLFVSYFINTVFNVWSVSVFLKNRIYLNSLKEIIGNILKVAILGVLFIKFDPHIYYIGIATISVTIFSILYDKIIKRILAPFLKTKITKKVYKNILELTSAGIWNVINTAGVLLLNGLDLLFANLILGSKIMGEISISKTIPMLLITISGLMPSYFAPVMTKLYAEGNNKMLTNFIHRANRISSWIIAVPIFGFLVYGKIFYSLWVPSINSTYLLILSLLAIIPLLINGGVQSIYNIFLITNRLKTNSLLVLLTGVLSTLTVLIVLKNYKYGAYIIVGISSMYILLRNIIYSIPYSAIYLGENRVEFLKDIKLLLKGGIIVIVIGIILKNLFIISNWKEFFIQIMVCSIISYVFSYFIVLSFEDKSIIYNIFRRFVKKLGSV